MSNISNPRQAQQPDQLAKREEFAVNLRKRKRQEIVSKKRSKLPTLPAPATPVTQATQARLAEEPASSEISTSFQLYTPPINAKFADLKLQTAKAVADAFREMPVKIENGLHNCDRWGHPIPAPWVENVRQMAKQVFRNIIDLAQYAGENRANMPQSALHLISTLKYYEILMENASPKFQFVPEKRIYMEEIRLLALSALSAMFYIEGSGKFFMEKARPTALHFFSDQGAYLIKNFSKQPQETLLEAAVYVCCLINLNADNVSIAQYTMKYKVVGLIGVLMKQVFSQVGSRAPH